MSSKEEKPPLTPETTFCPNFNCLAREQVGAGDIGVHSQKDHRYICRKCDKTFSATTGTLFYRLRKSTDLITLVVKLHSHGCQGTPEAVAEVIKQTQGKGDINTAFIERINGTFRSCLHSLARRTRSLAKQSKTLESGMYLVGCVYNFCIEHKSLRLPGLTGGHKWLE